jgi:hypothetical protein
MCYERRRAEAGVDWSAHHALVNAAAGEREIVRKKERESACIYYQQDLLQSCSRGERGIVEDTCYERRRAQAGVD